MWNIVTKTKSYNGKCDRCNLYLGEKLKYLNNPRLLNKINELMVTCQDKNKYLLKYVDEDSFLM